MIVPWLLLASIGAAVLAGAAWSRLRGGDVAGVLDLSLGVLLPAILCARGFVVLRDLALTGSLPPLAAVLTLGSGLSAGAAVLAGGLAARRLVARHAVTDVEAADVRSGAGLVDGEEGSDGEDRGDGRDVAAVIVLPEAWAAALATWHLLALVRGDVGTPPVALAEAAIWLVVLVVLRRPTWRLAAPGRRVGLGVAAAGWTVLLGVLVRPSLPTVDADVDTILAVLAAAVGTAALRGRAALATRFAAGGLALVVLVVGLAAADLGGDPVIITADADAGVGGPGLELLDGALRAGASAPADDVPQLDGDDLAALVAASDGPVVVNLWAAWCPPCHAEAPAVARAAAALPEDVLMLGVLVNDDVADGQAFADRYGLGFPTVVDAGISDAVGSVGLPTTVVLRTDGSVAHTEIGGLDVAGLAAAVQRARRP